MDLNIIWTKIYDKDSVVIQLVFNVKRLNQSGLQSVWFLVWGTSYSTLQSGRAAAEGTQPTKPLLITTCNNKAGAQEIRNVFSREEW